MSVPGEPPYGWESLPASQRESVQAFVSHLGEVLGDGLAGASLHGSLGRGCYHPLTSDVDLLLVTRESCDDAVLPRLSACDHQYGLHLHAVGATVAQLPCNEVPTPVEFELQTASSGELLGRRLSRGRGDFLLVRQDAYDCNATLLGLPVRELVPPVPWEALQVSAEHLFPYIVPHFKNPVLMLSRLCYAFAQHALCSKVAAGEWAMQTFAREWQDTIRAALASYRNGVPDNRGESPELRRFEAYCRQFMDLARP